MTSIFITRFDWNRTETVGEVAICTFNSHIVTVNENEKKKKSRKVKILGKDNKKAWKYGG